MYTTMLEEAVSKLKGEGHEERPQVSINLGISVRIESSYIEEENQRLRMYKLIAAAQTETNLAEIRDELQDRYGKPPETVLNLLAGAEIRLTCERLGIAQIERKRVAIDDKSTKPATKPGGQPLRPGAPGPSHLGTRGSAQFQSPYQRQWTAGTAPRPQYPLAGRHGQAPQSASLNFSPRAALNRATTAPDSNATRALRETAALRPANAPSAQAGKIAPMREFLYLTFSDKLHSAPASGDKLDGKGVNVGALMKLVSRGAKQGAQLTPQGVLRWPLSGPQPDVILKETRELLAQLGTQSQ